MAEPVLVDRSLMLYDGLCGVCNYAVQWAIRHDHADRLRFASQQSEVANKVLSRAGIDRASMLRGNSVYMLVDSGTTRERLLMQSDVTVHLLLTVGGVWRILGYCLRAVPRFARNAAYRLFARNRYRFSRRYDVCPVPAAGTRLKFLS